MSKSLTVIVVALAASFATPSTATAQVCNLPGRWTPIPRSIDVWVSAGTGVRIGVSDSTLADATARAAMIWNEEGGVPIKLKFRGIQSIPSPGFLPNAITVIGGHQYGISTEDASHTAAVDGSNNILYSYINIWNRAVHARTSYTYYTWVADREKDDLPLNTKDLVGTLVHELGHAAYRLKHPGDCTSPVTRSVMWSEVPRGRVLRQWDKDWARFYYGDRASYSVLKWSTFSDSASTWPAPYNLLGQFIAYRSGSLSQAHTWTNLAWTQRNPAGTSLGQVRQQYYLTGDNSFNQSKNLSDSLAGLGHPVGVAASTSTGEVLVAYRKRTQTSPYDTDGNIICYSKSSDNGQTFGAETCSYSGGIRYGLTAGYDPKTKTFLIAEARDAGNLMVYTIPGTGSSVPANATLLSWTSWHAPSIACKGSGIENCRMAWEEKSTNGCLTWGESHVAPATGAFQVSITRQQCYWQFDTPSIAYYPKDDTYRLASGVGNYAAYSYRMPAEGGTFWTVTGDIYNSFNEMISFPVLATEHFCFFGCSGNLRSWFVRFY